MKLKKSHNCHRNYIFEEIMVYTDILISLRKVLRSINLENKKIEKKYGVSTPQILVLNYLRSQNDYQSTATELKKYLNLNASTVTGIIARLEGKKLIAKLPDQKDRRVIKINLTVQGVNLLKKLPPALHERFSQRLSELKEEDLDMIKKSINLLVMLMEAEDIDASPVLTTKGNLSDK